MGKAEVGSTKYLSNQMRRKGLQKLKWWCELCSKQCFDDNGFKLHCQSESHMRNALAAGQNFRETQEEFSQAFLKNFLQLLKTGHGEKEIQINRFYQEVIAEKTHVHLNATKWSSLTEFAKFLGRESLCRVEEKDDGLYIAWVDNSPEALRRKEAVRRKEMQDRGDEEREQMLLREQIRRAQKEAEARGAAVPDGEAEEGTGSEVKELKRVEGEKVKLSFGASSSAPKADQKAQSGAAAGQKGSTLDPAQSTPAMDDEAADKHGATEAAPKAVSLKFGAKPQVKNVFSQAKKNVFGGGTKKTMVEQPEKMSEAKRIMLEEIRRKEEAEKRKGRPPSSTGPPTKRPKF